MDDVFKALGRVGLIPVVRLDDPKNAARLAEALQGGGLLCAEITFRAAGAPTAITQIAKEFPTMILGAGTVLQVDQAQQAVRAGARFIVSPGFSRPVVDWCLTHGVAVMPGVATPTEILMALDLGLDTMKVFPVEALGGVPFLEAITAPFSGVRLVPTGGVTAEKLATYLRLPSVLAVGGSWMVAPKLLSEERFDEVARLAREAVAVVARTRRGEP